LATSSAPDEGAIGTIPIRRFALNAVTTNDPFGAFRDLVMPNLDTIYETTPREAFDVAAKVAVIGRVGLSYMRVSAQRWDRPPETTRRNAVDHIVVNVRFAGGAVGDAAGRDLKVNSREILINDLAQAQVNDSERSHTATLVLPRSVAQTLVPDARSLHGLVIPAGPSSLLLRYLEELEPQIDRLPADVAGQIGSAALDLLAVALAQVTPARAPVASAVATAARRRAEQIIDDRLGSASLTVGNLARWTGVSRSTLYRLFEPDGGVQAVIRDRRLARVAADLRDPSGTARIADIAERWGFCDAAYLGRVFREVHGVTPGEYRAGETS
jgi:AraC-like DNA-binding protein